MVLFCLHYFSQSWMNMNMDRTEKCMFFLWGLKSRFLAQKSETVNFPPWDRFFDFSFPSIGCFHEKKKVKNSSPSPLWGHCLSRAGWMIPKITYLHSPTSFSLIVFSLTPHSDVESEPKKAILPSSWLIPGLSRNVDPLKLRRYRLRKGLPCLTWV